MNHFEDSNQADLTGFPPGLSAPIRPAVPRRTPSQLSLGSPALASTGEPDDPPTSLCASLRSPLSSSLGSPMIDIDDDLDELELDDLDADDLGDGDLGLALMSDEGANGPRMTDRELAPGQTVPGAATLGDRARRLGARLVHKVLVPVAAIAILVIAMGGTWSTAGATPTTFAATQPGARAAAGASAAGTASARAAADEPEHATRSKAGHRELSGKLNLNTATEDQLMVLPSVGPAKA